MIWNQTTYRDHIKSVVEIVGEYHGGKYQLVHRYSDDYWFGLNTNGFPTEETKIFNTLDEAVDHFLEFEPLLDASTDREMS